MRNPLLIVGIIIAIISSLSVYFFFLEGSQSVSFISPVAKQLKETVKPLEKYSFKNLRDTHPEKSEIKIEALLAEETGFTSHLFSYTAEGKRITGQLNIPTATVPVEGFPVVLMLRGYIDPETYQTGDGTRSAAAVFANNGFITIAPDFLGHGGSDDPDANTISARLKRPYNLLVLINSLETIPYALDPSRLSMWGHSNGGQIALSLLEITDKQIPTTLWAPVSKSFPYSILYYTDESDDRGKALRQVIADFEKDYDVDNFSIHNYQYIDSPIQIHQGTADDSVPKDWSDELVNKLEELEKDVTYFVYSGSDHNLRPAWNTVVQRDIQFFRSELKDK